MDYENKLIDDGYKKIARDVHALFKTELGEKVLNSFYQLFCHGYFDINHPSERALQQQGQASVVYEIKEMIRKIDEGLL